MASGDLIKSWKRTEGFLRDSRSHFSQVGDAICEEELRQFGEFIEHNEFELALDKLEEAFTKSGSNEVWRVLELMALAAASMGLVQRQEQYDKQLSSARGWKYQTVLPK